MARCPAHDDDRSSLSIRDAEDRVLIKCHASCCTSAVMAKMGLRMVDLFFGNTTSLVDRKIIKVYPYRDEKGILLYETVRFEPKDFRQRHANGSWTLNGVRRVLYRLNEIQGRRTVYIVEGEKDADTIYKHGRFATTNVSGAGKWLPEYTKQLIAAGVWRDLARTIRRRK